MGIVHTFLTQEVSVNCLFEAGGARPLVRLAIHERDWDHQRLLQAGCFVVVGYGTEAAREKITAQVAGLTHVD